jgi:hypothetical protein
VLYLPQVLSQQEVARLIDAAQRSFSSHPADDALRHRRSEDGITSASPTIQELSDAQMPSGGISEKLGSGNLRIERTSANLDTQVLEEPQPCSWIGKTFFMPSAPPFC